MILIWQLSLVLCICCSRGKQGCHISRSPQQYKNVCVNLLSLAACEMWFKVDYVLWTCQQMLWKQRSVQINTVIQFISQSLCYLQTICIYTVCLYMGLTTQHCSAVQQRVDPRSCGIISGKICLELHKEDRHTPAMHRSEMNFENIF